MGQLLWADSKLDCIHVFMSYGAPKFFTTNKNLMNPPYSKGTKKTPFPSQGKNLKLPNIPPTHRVFEWDFFVGCYWGFRGAPSLTFLFLNHHAALEDCDIPADADPSANPTRSRARGLSPDRWVTRVPKVLLKDPKGDTLPETNSKSPRKWAETQKEKIVFQPLICRCDLLVSGRVHDIVVKSGQGRRRNDASTRSLYI